MKKNGTEAIMLPWRNGPKCELDHFYREKGFYPALKPEEKETVKEVHGFEKRQSVAITLAHSYDDWALAEMAGGSGNSGQNALMLQVWSDNFQWGMNRASIFHIYTIMQESPGKPKSVSVFSSTCGFRTIFLVFPVMRTVVA